MSSIYGKINFNKRPVELDQLATMESVLNHWEADDKGLWNNQCAGLGHLMLYNTPESLNEKLPFHNSLSGVTVTADARIDNREDLFVKLAIAREDHKLVPDSLLILKAYEKYGEHCVHHLIGDFAFAIWDEQEQKLFCARDHMGVKPFFYYHDKSFFAFATEKKGILCLTGIDQAINEQFFYNMLIFQSVQAADTTLYKKIRRLPPANTLSVSVSNITLNTYWTLDATLESDLVGREANVEGLLYHFEEAVKCRSRSAYPVGAELSGGMDSSAITGVADKFLKLNGKHLITFSNVLPDGVTDKTILDTNGRHLVDLVINFNKIKEFVYITKGIWDDPVGELDFILNANDGLEPFTPGWQLPLKNAAKNHGVRTLFSGFPGDQMVTSRGKGYFLDLLEKRRYKEYLLAPRRFNSQFNKVMPFIPPDLTLKIRNFLDEIGLYRKEIRTAESVFNIPAKFKKNNKNGNWAHAAYKDIYKSYRHSQKYTLLKNLTAQRLEGETRFGLYYRLEPRFPMADIRLTQFYLSMPNEYKYKGVLSRPAFRDAMKNYLPPELLVYDSKKEGNAPFLNLEKDKRGKMLETLISELPDTVFIKKDALVKEYLKDIVNNRYKLLPGLNIHTFTFRWLTKVKPKLFF
jgi:asparagine synthase (glutamine-hydrolysing)